MTPQPKAVSWVATGNVDADWSPYALASYLSQQRQAPPSAERRENIALDSTSLPEQCRLVEYAVRF